MEFDLQQRLRDVAVESVNEQEVLWEEDGFDTLQTIITQGVTKLRTEEPTVNRDVLEGRVRTLVENISSFAEAAGGGSVNAQTVQTGIEARGIWPFS
jgi:hypothetical protein